MSRTPKELRTERSAVKTETADPSTDEVGTVAQAPVPSVIKEKIDEALSLAHVEPPMRAHLERVVLEVVQEVTTFSGPIPPPDVIREYEAIIPGAAKEILAMAVREQKHRHWWEKVALLNTTAGLVGGFIIGLGLIAGGIYATSLGASGVAIAFLSTGAVSMVPTLIRGRDFVMQLFPAKAPPENSANRPPSGRQSLARKGKRNR